MKNLVLALMLILFGACTLDNLGEQQLVHENILKNGGFESGRAFWSAEDGTFTSREAQDNPLYAARGKAGVNWAPTADDGIFSDTYDVPVKLQGKPCLLEFKYNTVSGLFLAEVYASVGGQLFSDTIATSTSWTTHSSSFTCPASGTFYVKITSSAATSTINVDEVYLGYDYKYLDAGDGLTLTPPETLSVNVDDSTIEISADILGVKALGIDTGQLNALAVTTAKIDDGAVTQVKLAAKTLICGTPLTTWSSTSSSYSGAIVNTTITPSGTNRPIIVSLQNTQVESGYIGASRVAGQGRCHFKIERNSVPKYYAEIQTNCGSGVCTSNIPPGSIHYIDTNFGSSSVVFSFHARAHTGTSMTCSVARVQLCAYEL